MVIKEVWRVWFISFFDKKSTAEPSSLERMGSGIASSSMLANELHKPIIKKIDKRKVYSQFKDNI